MCRLIHNLTIENNDPMPSPNFEFPGNIDSNGLKLLMGPFFFHNSSFQACARPLGPKGSIFSFFIYLFEFLLILIHLNHFNIWKIFNSP